MVDERKGMSISDAILLVINGAKAMDEALTEVVPKEYHAKFYERYKKHLDDLTENPTTIIACR